jgi:hypothetical protein
MEGVASSLQAWISSSPSKRVVCHKLITYGIVLVRTCAVRLEPHHDLLLKARVYRVLSTDTCGRGKFSSRSQKDNLIRRRPWPAVETSESD